MKLSKEKFSRQLKYLKQQRQQQTVSQTELGGIACQQANMQKGKQSDRQGDKLLNEQTRLTSIMVSSLFSSSTSSLEI